MIYLTKEDWNNLILSKLSKKESFMQQFAELFKLNTVFRYFTKNIYSKAATPQEQTYILLASLVIFHKYRISTNFSVNKYSSAEIYIIIGACLSIGQVVVNALLMPVKILSEYIKKEIDKRYPDKNIKLKKIIEKIKEKKFEILLSIGFNIEVDFPFYYYNKIKNHLLKIQNFPQNSISFLNSLIKESFIMPFCLYYTPNIITISSVLILKEKFKLNYINIKELISLSDYDLNEADILECTSLLQALDAAVIQVITEKTNGIKGTENIKTNNNINNTDANQANSAQTSITKIIPSINMNTE